MRRLLTGVVLACAMVASAPTVHADDMDITLARLRVPAWSGGAPAMNLPEGCFATGENGQPRYFCPDNDSWRRLMSQLGGSMIPPVTSGARTVGYGGFYVGADMWITPIDSDADYWRLGTEGDESAGSGDCPIDNGLGCNRFVDGTLIWSRIQIRKGFPFGFELGTSFSYLLNTEVWAWGLEIKWALFEGFRTGVGFLPDLAVRGMVNTLVSDQEFNLTIPSIDVVLSKPIPIAGTGVITPFASAQISFLFADSELIDLTPDIDAFEECRPDPAQVSTACTGGTVGRTPAGFPDRGPGADYNNNTTFDRMRVTRWRLALGAQGRYQAITLTASFAFDLLKPGSADEDVPEDLQRQITVAVGAGLTF